MKNKEHSKEELKRKLAALQDHMTYMSHRLVDLDPDSEAFKEVEKELKACLRLTSILLKQL